MADQNTKLVISLERRQQESGLADTLALPFPDQPAERWTSHDTTNQPIDDSLISPLLYQALRRAGIARRGTANVARFLTAGMVISSRTLTKTCLKR